VTTDKSGRTSVGILLWRSREGRLEVLLAHQGGPFWVKKDIGHWTIPKGEIDPGEEDVAVARREFAEETGHEAPDHPLLDLGQITQKSGKLVLGWAVQGDLDPSTAVSNTYDMEWPPQSGVVQAFPEIDRVEWFDLDEARRRLKAAQVPFLLGFKPRSHPTTGRSGKTSAAPHGMRLGMDRRGAAVSSWDRGQLHPRRAARTSLHAITTPGLTTPCPRAREGL
jgi:predicted NUDIX family NTP pyrophosphohydrolase